MNYFCCTDTRRDAVKLHPVLNGIDYLEVLDNASDPCYERQTTLFLHFLKPLLPGSLFASNFIITGGVRLKNIKVIDVQPEVSQGAEVLSVKVSQAGDFSTYTLQLIKDENDNNQPDGFDPVFSSIDFSFKAACQSDFDCKQVCQCISTPVASPEINYLTKDYEGFRRLMLDRMTLLIPGWKEQNPSDMGIALIELLAYTADYLSYRQDAYATEAYLNTCRKRISARRHARLVDYYMHDGSNARTWLHLHVGENISGLPLKKGKGSDTTKVLTRQEGLPTILRTESKEFENAVNEGTLVFELMHDILLYTEHNEMTFYTWGGKICCLPKGANRATLSGNLSHLNAGDVLILCEVLGPTTGLPGDADPSHRHAVRLTEVSFSNDILYETTGSPPGNVSFPVTEIVWNESDALPFPLCISSYNGTDNISIALGNNVMVDHGQTYEDEKVSSLSPSIVPDPTMKYVKTDAFGGCDFCETAENELVAVRYNPKLTKVPLTNAAPFNFSNLKLPAGSLMTWSMRDTMPSIVLKGKPQGTDDSKFHEWNPRHDLLNSAANAKEFVVETEADGISYLRFGDGKEGEKPATETEFFAIYRIGNGMNGNIGAQSLAHLVTCDSDLLSYLSGNTTVWNPLPASGGIEPETIEEVKQLAPNAFRKQERAVNEVDYEEFSKKCFPDIQHTATTFRWTGSWKTVFLTVDRLGGLSVDTVYKKDMVNALEQYRMAGFDLEIESPVEVSLELEIMVCVNKAFFASDVKTALLELFCNRILPDGRKGIFHPDNFSFGEPVYLSRLYAAAQSVQGVDSLKITKLVRQGDTNNEAVHTGKLVLGSREIARLDNDPNFPDHGVLNLIMNGGR